MAKWGEGDPRWIVEERPDAINVNNWHWTEKDATNWSKDRIKEIFTGVKISSDQGECEINDVTKIEGEASANNRKGKLIFFYDWSLKLHWKGMVNGCSDKIKGSVEIPNLSEENGLDDISITVTCKNEDSKGELLKNLMRTVGEKKIKELIDAYITSLKNDFAVGMILPKKDEAKRVNGLEKSVYSAQSAVHVNSESTNTSSMKRMEISDSKPQTTSLTSKQSFKCTAEELFNALTVEQLVQAFTRGPCLLEPMENGRFELFGGNVSGTFIKLVPHTEIQMKWRFSAWPTNHFSNVTIKIVQKTEVTEINFEQTGIPSLDHERTKSGWPQYYWEAIKRTFGFGATLY